VSKRSSPFVYKDLLLAPCISRASARFEVVPCEIAVENPNRVIRRVAIFPQACGSATFVTAQKHCAMDVGARSRPDR
jgi:hypothetical protein